MEGLSWFLFERSSSRDQLIGDFYLHSSRQRLWWPDSVGANTTRHLSKCKLKFEVKSQRAMQYNCWKWDRWSLADVSVGGSGDKLLFVKLWIIHKVKWVHNISKNNWSLHFFNFLRTYQIWKVIKTDAPNSLSDGWAKVESEAAAAEQVPWEWASWIIGWHLNMISNLH